MNERAWPPEMGEYESETEYWLDCIDLHFPSQGRACAGVVQEIEDGELSAEGYYFFLRAMAKDD